MKDKSNLRPIAGKAFIGAAGFAGPLAGIVLYKTRWGRVSLHSRFSNNFRRDGTDFAQSRWMGFDVENAILPPIPEGTSTLLLLGAFGFIGRRPCRSDFGLNIASTTRCTSTDVSFQTKTPDQNREHFVPGFSVVMTCSSNGRAPSAWEDLFWDDRLKRCSRGVSNLAR